jgi:OFA family oxalate/formate antiporter-like MFS transporter
MSTPRRWSILIAAMLVQAAMVGSTLNVLTLWATPWMRTFGVSHGAIMIVTSCLLLGLGLFSPLGGRLAEKVPIRILMTAGAGLGALGFVLVSLAGSMWEVTAIFALILAPAIMLGGQMMGQIVAVRLFEERAGLAIGVANIGTSIGGFCMPLVVGHLLADYDWRRCFVILACGFVALMPLIFATVAVPMPKTAGGVTDRTEGSPPATLSIGAIMRDRTFIGAVMFMLSLSLVFNGIYFNLGPYFADMGGGAGEAAKILAVSAILGFIGTGGLGALADRIDYRLLMLGILVAVGGGAIAFAVGASFDLMIIVVPITAGGMGGMISLMPAMLAKHFGAANFTRANSLLQPFLNLSSPAVFLFGLGRDVFGSYAVVFTIGLVTLIPAGLSIALVHRPRSRAVSAV